MEEDIVIVGGGICGIATALALSRRGIRCVVLEKTEALRTDGSAAIIQSNGWRALEQLGVASDLRQMATQITMGRQVSVLDNSEEAIVLGKGEMRVLERKVLLETLAASLPANTMRFGCQAVSIYLDSSTSFPVLQLRDGCILKPKIVVGCDGMYSIVADFLKVNKTRAFSTCVVRGYTEYSNGHDFGNEFLVACNKSFNIQLGRMPMSDNLVYWFLTRKWTPQDSTISTDANLIKKSTEQCLVKHNFPREYVDMIMDSKADSLYLTPPLRFRVPWEMMKRSFHKGTVVVSGDAMHAMSPFLGQGGSMALEDAVVLARCLKGVAKGGFNNLRLIEAALDRYVKERKMRVVKVCSQAFLIGTALDTNAVIKFLVILLLMVFFSDPTAHSNYNCGTL